MTVYNENHKELKVTTEHLPYMPFGAQLIGVKYQIPSNLHVAGDGHPLNKNSEMVMAPVRKVIEEASNEYNHNDIRLLMKDQPYAKTSYGDAIMRGLVSGYKYTLKNNVLKLYILIRDVAGLTTKGNNNYACKHLTDHLWLDINDFILKSPLDSLDIGIGDEILFGAKIVKYHGYRNNIKQIKYGVSKIQILSAGYPLIYMSPINKDNPNDPINSQYYPFNPIIYNHHEHKLLTMYNRDKYPISTPDFGNQIERHIQKAAQRKNIKIGHLPNVNLHGQIKYAFKNETTKHELNDQYKLIFENSMTDFAKKHPIHWANETYHLENNQIELFKLSALLPNTTFEDMYRRALELTKYRRTIK